MAVTSSPNILTWPLAGRWLPAMTPTSVLFPAPFGPTMAVTDPSGTTSETRSSAVTPPNLTTTSSTSMAGGPPRVTGDDVVTSLVAAVARAGCVAALPDVRPVDATSSADATPADIGGPPVSDWSASPTSSIAATAYFRRRSRMSPAGRNQRKRTVTSPTAIHSREGPRSGDPGMAGRYRDPSANATGTRSAPRAAPQTLPTPPTMRAVSRTNVSVNSQLAGDQAPMKATSSPPLNPPSTPPQNSAPSHSLATDLPVARATASLLRAVRIARPAGERESDQTIQNDTMSAGTQTTA